MKRAYALIISFCLVISACFLGGCKNEENYRINVVTTVFSEYDWVKNVVGDVDGVGVTMLLDSGVDLHSYSPTPKDYVTVSNCDLFVYVGGESDEWVEGALNQAKNKNMATINLLEVLGDKAREEEEVEGMEEEDHDHGEEETEYDEHVWLSLKNAKLFVNEIKDKLCSIDGENSSKYAANAANYISKLDALDEKYTQAVAGKIKDTLLFADRFPFLYLVKDYGLKYFAAFKGCSAASEASFNTMAFLSGKVDELSLSVILKLESSDGSIAQTVKNSTISKDQKILTLDSLQSSTIKEYEAGRNYLGVMEENLEVLKEALK